MTSVANPDPGSVAFLTPGPGSGIGDLGSGMGKNQDPGSGIRNTVTDGTVHVVKSRKLCPFCSYCIYKMFLKTHGLYLTFQPMEHKMNLTLACYLP
jgi:hypothetical protein